MELLELTRKLVSIESTTGREGMCVEFLCDYLEACKFQVETQPVSPARANVFARSGSPEVVLSTHMDTVPPFIPFREDADFFYGRGACDAKGIIAAQIVAAQRLRGEGVQNIGLLFLVGEETTSDGAQAADLLAPGSKYIINGEPTDNKLAVGTKGHLLLRIRTRGKAAHSAYPHLGESAIEKLLAILEHLRKLPLPQDPVLGSATLNVGVISGGCAANVVAAEAEAQLSIRTVNGAQELRRQLVEQLEGRCEYEFVRDTPALRLEALDGYPSDVVAFATDLPSLTNWGRPLLVGPGSIHDAHTDHECVRKAALCEAVDLYCRLVRDLKARRG